MIRNTYPDLKNTTVKTWKSWFNEDFGQFVDVAPFEHRMRFTLPDRTIVDSEVIFLALDREEHIKKLLSLELTGAYVNEVREVRRAIVEALDGRIGRYPRMMDGGPTWHGIVADTNMPDEDHWLLEMVNDKDSGWEFFKQPGGVIKDGDKWVANPQAENLGNLPPGYYTNQLQGKTPEYIQVYLAAEYGSIPKEGAYFFEDIATAERQGRVGDVLPDPALPVHTFWDMGVDDDMSIWFGQGSQGQWRWVDYYENSGKNLNHYATVVADKQRERRWVYGNDVWPHDGNVREMTGVSQQQAADQAPRRAQIWKELTGREPIVLANAPLSDGIENGRNLIGVSRFDRKSCGEGLQKLRRYKRHMDKVRMVFTAHEEKDGNDHAGAAWRTAAMGRNRVSNSAQTWPDHIIHQSFNAA